MGSLREAAGDCGPRSGPDTQRACLETSRGAGGTMCDVVMEHAPSLDGRKVLTVFNPCVLWKRRFNIAWTLFLSYTRGSPRLMYLFAKTF